LKNNKVFNDKFGVECEKDRKKTKT